LEERTVTMPYPESCPECGSTFRNTGTHFTARRNEVGRHVLLELGCQNTTRRFWWDFTTGSLTQDGRPGAARQPNLEASLTAASASNGAVHAETNGHVAVSSIEPPSKTVSSIDPPSGSMPPIEPPSKPTSPQDALATTPSVLDALDTAPERLKIDDQVVAAAEPELVPEPELRLDPTPEPESSLALPIVDLPGPPLSTSPPLKDAFVRQLQLDRLTLRQMRSWLMSEDARRAIEVAAGATEATYERLALILFGVDLPQLLGKQTAVPATTGMSAEERLELQRERARIRARLRRAAAKAARQSE
jgi:hypothetical protein